MNLLDDLRVALGLTPEQNTTWESFSQVLGPTGEALPSTGVPAVTAVMPAAGAPIFKSSFVPAYYVIIGVRSLGTSTYVRIGNSQGQVLSLYTVTDTIIVSGPQGKVFDAAQVFGMSQNGDATLEVMGMFPGS